MANKLYSKLQARDREDKVYAGSLHIGPTGSVTQVRGLGVAAAQSGSNGNYQIILDGAFSSCSAQLQLQGANLPYFASITGSGYMTSSWQSGDTGGNIVTGLCFQIVNGNGVVVTPDTTASFDCNYHITVRNSVTPN